MSWRGIDSQTKITIRYSSPMAAESIMNAIKPDNIDAPDGINIEADVDESTLSIHIASNKSLGSLVSTLDDLLSCIQAAESTLKHQF